MMALYRPKHVSGTSEMTNDYLILIVQFVGLIAAYFPKDGPQVVPKYVGDFLFIVCKFHCVEVWCYRYIMFS